VTQKDAFSLAEQLRAILNKIPDPSVLKAQSAKKLRDELQQVAVELTGKLSALDPVQQPHSFFNPADPRLFGIFAAVALIGQHRVPLASVESERFYGSGIYAIYYNGGFPLYAPIAKTEHPIYVGKADPDETYAKIPERQGTRLSARLNEHRKSVAKATESLRMEDFECRYLVVASGWQVAAENALIQLFRPLWNRETQIIYGFGKHGDSAETRKNRRSPWDTLHSGRAWADATTEDAKTADEIAVEVAGHFAKHPVVANLENVLESLLDNIKTR
jgi:hypothetical protein